MDFNELITRFASAIGRRLRLFFLVFFVCFSAAVVGAYAKPQWFGSEASLLISLESQWLSTSQSEQRKVFASAQPEEVVESQAALLRTRDLTEKVVDELPAWVFESTPSSKWYIRMIMYVVKPIIETPEYLLVKVKLIEPPNPRYEKIRTIEKGLTVFPVRKAQVIQLSFRSKNPEVPKVVLDTIIKTYKARASELKAQADGVVRRHSNFAQIIDPPTTPYMPLKPSRLLLVIAGFFFALVLAAVSILLVEWIDQLRLVYGKNKS